MSDTEKSLQKQVEDLAQRLADETQKRMQAETDKSEILADTQNKIRGLEADNANLREKVRNVQGLSAEESTPDFIAGVNARLKHGTMGREFAIECERAQRRHDRELAENAKIASEAKTLAATTAN